MTPLPIKPEVYAESQRLYARAVKVIPGGIYGHHSPSSILPCASPYYAMRAEGGRYWDVDGREYIDLMCGYGPIVLGHQNAEVEAAADRQRKMGDCMNHPTKLMIELAEWFVQQIDFADWAVFGKNGSDMTTWALQVAREYTKRKKIFSIYGAYHGMDTWCTPGHAGLVEEDRAHIHLFKWNDLNGFHELFRRYKDDLAAVILTPYHHPVFADQEWAEPQFFRDIQQSCREHGVLIILDDIRAGFRLNAEGSHTKVGLKPDIACYCKAMANGYPISATVGDKKLKNSASKVFLTGSYWNGAVSMAAALATLNILKRDKVSNHLEKLGTQLKQGLESLGQRYKLPLKASGPGCAPYIRFVNDAGFHLQQSFCSIAMENGVFLHPHHNWFLCAEHTSADIAQVLTVAEKAMKKILAKPL